MIDSRALFQQFRKAITFVTSNLPTTTTTPHPHTQKSRPLISRCVVVILIVEALARKATTHHKASLLLLHNVPFFLDGMLRIALDGGGAVD